VAARYEARTIFAHSDTGIVSLKPTQGMDVYVHLFCVCVVLYVGSCLATGWSPAKGVLLTAYKNKKLKKTSIEKGKNETQLSQSRLIFLPRLIKSKSTVRPVEIGKKHWHCTVLCGTLILLYFLCHFSCTRNESGALSAFSICPSSTECAVDMIESTDIRVVCKVWVICPNLQFVIRPSHKASINYVPSSCYKIISVFS
jgi:hypothetical protein